MTTNKQKQALKKLGLTNEEIAEVLKADAEIDKGKKLFELPKELAAGAKKARNAGNCRGYAKTANPNKTKAFQLLTNSVESANIIQADSEFTFYINGEQFRVKLTKVNKIKKNDIILFDSILFSTLSQFLII